MTDKIRLEVHDHVLAIGLNRPDKLNAFDLEMFHALARAFHRLHTDPELRCGLLYGEGEHLCSGLDLPQWAPVFADGGGPTFADDELDPFGLDPERRLGKPMVVALQGICFTVAIELALAADIRVAAENARFGQIEVRRGIYPVGGATFRMVQEFGWGNAQRYLLTGDEFDAAEALRLGLVQEVVPVGQQRDRAMALAQRVAAQAPLAVQASLASSRIGLTQGPAAAASRLLSDLAPLMKTEDVAEGVASFLERRPARFKGR